MAEETPQEDRTEEPTARRMERRERKVKFLGLKT